MIRLLEFQLCCFVGRVLFRKEELWQKGGVQGGSEGPTGNHDTDIEDGEERHELDQ